jgi:hypothetical protein
MERCRCYFLYRINLGLFLFIRKQARGDSERPSTVKTGTGESSSRLDNFNSIAIEYAAEFKEAEQAVEVRQKELRVAIANDPELYRKFQQDLNTLDSSYRVLREQASQSMNGGCNTQSHDPKPAITIGIAGPAVDDHP